MLEARVKSARAVRERFLNEIEIKFNRAAADRSRMQYQLLLY